MPEQPMDEKVVFQVACCIESAEIRDGYLDQVCGDNHDMRFRLETLLRMHDESPSFLETPARGNAAPTIDLRPVTECPGTHIGPYRLVQEIGEGGMGMVFLAVQKDPVRRKVALKVIKPGMDTKQVIARFEAERQALAMMDHPNIARVLDAGCTETGRPYFVMELVKGVAINKFCDDNHLTAKQRLELFVLVCQAVQHAHQKGIIHRDLKPSNILIALYDDRPVPKIIDFGVAKAIHQLLTDKTLCTQVGQIVGTWEYMSPEQAVLNQLDVDTRTDIYSLGVILYELLAGVTPLENNRLCTAAFDEKLRLIREEEPRKPSSRISTLGNTAVAICERRRTDPRRLSLLLRGDLDWIVMKALDKDRARRYDTAKDFAADISRYLCHQPVDASSPSLVYRLKKCVHRNRRSIGFTATALLLLLSLIFGVWNYINGQKWILTANRMRAREEALQRFHEDELPRLEALAGQRKWPEVFRLATEFRRRFPEDKDVSRIWYAASCAWRIESTPSGASVYLAPYGSSNAMELLGTTPLYYVSLPKGYHHWRVELPGCSTREGVSGPNDVQLDISLVGEGEIPTEMVLVEGTLENTDAQESLHLTRRLPIHFMVDRFEVTNRDYKWFVESGGYINKEYWQDVFLDGDKVLTLEEALGRFVDRTGEPGPATWSNCTYPSGEDDFPVRGISWYEASAYARFVKKRLIPLAYWRIACGAASAELFEPVWRDSNVGGNGPKAVGSGIGPFGTYDMAGNVTEWCLNEGRPGTRLVAGGAWDDPEYMFSGGCLEVSALHRNDRTGFRCAVYASPPFRCIEEPVDTGHSAQMEPVPIPDALFDTIRQLYSYQRRDWHVQVSRGDEIHGFRHDILTLDSPYCAERVNAHLIFPQRGSPPYQVVVYSPGAGAEQVTEFSETAFDVRHVLPHLAHGRAVLFPVHEATFERSAIRLPWENVNYWIHRCQDIQTSIDALEGRNDVLATKLAFHGYSRGGHLGPAFLAVETRFKVAALESAGLWSGRLEPAVDNYHFAQRVTTPVLMVNGKLDTIFPFQESQLPLFEAFRTELTDKRHLLFDDVGHAVSLQQMDTAISDWFDKYMGVPGS